MHHLLQTPLSLALNLTAQNTVTGTLFSNTKSFLTDVNTSSIWEWFTAHWDSFTAWLLQPHVLAIVMAWWITFTLVMTICMTLGFGPAGIVAGSIAAGFQSWMYGGFTPAGGLFATLTSVGMLGIAMPPFALIAALVATIVSVVVWAYMR
ncbi:hypothetical protein G7Y89_g15590 [Cudoniella acicularis]|uniref:Uncharacterized protein n=1 Tax=Cudoniella acicularis TaxID=354080 RepID=A0A8H4QJZ7_9HELO|nr:hypothetical protein G7Y89_g15590 [Cudoniella acicularis]